MKNMNWILIPMSLIALTVMSAEAFAFPTFCYYLGRDPGTGDTSVPSTLAEAKARSLGCGVVDLSSYPLDLKFTGEKRIEMRVYSQGQGTKAAKRKLICDSHDEALQLMNVLRTVGDIVVYAKDPKPHFYTLDSSETIIPNIHLKYDSEEGILSGTMTCDGTLFFDQKSGRPYVVGTPSEEFIREIQR